MNGARTLVVVFLRGGLDGLSAIVPWSDEAYHRARPLLRLAEPKAGDDASPLRLDDRFALHPSLAALRPLWDSGRLGIVHAAGSDDPTRSHFEAQDQMEHGCAADAPLAGGWIARWLRAADETGPLSAIAFGPRLPESLHGAASACAVESIDQLSVATRTGDGTGFATALAALHARGASAGAAALVRKSGRDALALLDRVEDLRRAPPAGGDVPATGLARSLSQIARLVRGRLGLRAATVDHGGFDTHYVQATQLPGLLRDLAEALVSFERELGEDRDLVTTLCITEFGRRLDENGSLGTDHGRASVAFALGGGVRGGRVVARWPGLGESQLEDGLDLRVTTDYRALLRDALVRRFGLGDAAAVFPGLDAPDTEVF